MCKKFKIFPNYAIYFNMTKFSPTPNIYKVNHVSAYVIKLTTTTFRIIIIKF